jgi:imidazoleglycerol phosphate dehydratase HisB
VPGRDGPVRPALPGFRSRFRDGRIGDFDPSLIRGFFKAFADHSGTTLHIQIIHGGNSHHMAEAIFKASPVP